MAHPFPPVQPSGSLPPPIPSFLYHHSHRHGGALERGWIPRPVTHKPVVDTQVVAPSDVGGDAHAAGFVFTRLLNGGSKISIIHHEMDSELPWLRCP